MPLTHLKSPEAAARWLKSWVTGTLRADSRRVQAGDAFIAWPGYAHDGRAYVNAALAAGATTCLVEAEGVAAFGFEDARVATLPQMKAATGHIAAAYFDQPSTELAVVATTGTNGKTSTAWWTAQALTLLGRRCGVVGTLGIGEPPLGAAAAGGGQGSVVATGLTTPDPVTLQANLRRMVAEGFAACAMEASSHGIQEHRLAGTAIDVALFTNLTRDHLDYHGSMEAYWATKRSLFNWPGLKAACLNVDDAKGAELAAELTAEVSAGRALDLWTVSAQGPARLCAQGLRYVDGGLAFELLETGAQAPVPVPVRSTLIGDYNAHNLLVVLAGLRALGVPLAQAAAVVPQLTPVPGRMQRVGSAPLEVVVDYAHTPDALEKALAALRPLAAARGGRLWCVFGCGGDRDNSKRPIMGRIAGEQADHVVLTSDNPRSEAPEAILAHILAGLPQPDAVITDRRAAIEHAIAAAAANDVVCVAGKGHEDYQEVNGQRQPFLDAAVVLQALAQRFGAGE